MDTVNENTLLREDKYTKAHVKELSFVVNIIIIRYYAL